MQNQTQYLPYKLGLVCPHGQSKSSTNYLDVACNKRSQTYHRITQAGKICNKCAALIMRCINSVDECPCCSDSLQILISQSWICSHSNRLFDQITIKCLSDEKETHEIPFQQKVCKNCYEKIRAAFMFSKQCLVCNEKQRQVFQNIEKTITKSSFYLFEQIIKQMKNNKYSEQQMKAEIQYYCLADPRESQFQSKFQNQYKQFGENLPENHQSKRFHLFPKCTIHRQKPISLCNNCLVSILNVKSCPYGCPYEKKQARVGKVDVQIINQSGFLCLYPKQTKDYQYLEYFCVRHIQQSSKIDKWQAILRKIRYSGKNNICNKFSLYSASVQIGKSSFLQCGGSLGSNISNMKTTNSSFIIQISENHKDFTVEDLPDMSQSRSSHALVFHKDYVYVMGGFNKEAKKALKSCQRFNLKSKKWQEMASLHIERSKSSAFVLNGKIYIFGGFSQNQQIWNSQCQLYNIQKNTWQIYDYKGYDVPYLTGASFINNCWGLNNLANVFIFGGSNYEMGTYYMQDMTLLGNGFNLNYVDLQKKLNFTRAHASLSQMKTQSESEKIILIFGGVQEHEQLMSIDAIRMKQTKNEISPIFVYEQIPVGSYRSLLRQNKLSAYSYMIKKLTQQGFITKQKLENKEESQIMKSDACLHLIEKMWYGVGKCIVGYNS